MKLNKKDFPNDEDTVDQFNYLHTKDFSTFIIIGVKETSDDDYEFSLTFNMKIPEILLLKVLTEAAKQVLGTTPGVIDRE